VKGDALYMMELVLSLEKLNFHKLRLLHDIACKHDDAEMADFIGGLLLITIILDELCSEDSKLRYTAVSVNAVRC
jgi:hypothetical protein